MEIRFKNLWFRSCVLLFAGVFSFSLLGTDLLRLHCAYAAIVELPEIGTLINVSQVDTVSPLLKGIRINPDNPLDFEFIVDAQNSKDVSNEQAEKLIKYFMATLTIPQADLWVNLSPYENDRVATDSLSVTDLGSGLLKQDYLLKQLSASLTHPDTELGREYWNAIQGTAKNTLNKIWIMPDLAEVYENGDSAFITEATLKVLTEADYLALEQNAVTDQASASDSIKNLLIPKITDDVNNGENFSELRQIYHSIILGLWFKERFMESAFKHYINQNKVSGIDIEDKDIKEKIFAQYVQSFKKGVYDITKKEYSLDSNAKIKRNYFSGGKTFRELELKTTGTKAKAKSNISSAISIKAFANVTELEENSSSSIEKEAETDALYFADKLIYVFKNYKKLLVNGLIPGDSVLFEEQIEDVFWRVVGEMRDDVLFFNGNEPYNYSKAYIQSLKDDELATGLLLKLIEFDYVKTYELRQRDATNYKSALDLALLYKRKSAQKNSDQDLLSIVKAAELDVALKYWNWINNENELSYESYILAMQKNDLEEALVTDDKATKARAEYMLDILDGFDEVSPISTSSAIMADDAFLEALVEAGTNKGYEDYRKGLDYLAYISLVDVTASLDRQAFASDSFKQLAAKHPEYINRYVEDKISKFKDSLDVVLLRKEFALYLSTINQIKKDKGLDSIDRIKATVEEELRRVGGVSLKELKVSSAIGSSEIEFKGLDLAQGALNFTIVSKDKLDALQFAKLLDLNN